MPTIQVLREDVINQIAAGEVVERPASVAKELIENALDAGSRRIEVTVEQGGRRRIRVADDGSGMERDEALLALQRHATSKLREAADLAGIGTLGFRGEALPAIASVSRMVLSTSTGGAAGHRIEVEAGRISGVRETGHPRGTTLDVQDLFFNTPARARFLRSPAAELAQIHECVAAIATGSPGVHFTLEHEGRSLLQVAPVADLRDRVIDLHGDRWKEAISFSGERGGIRTSGWICPPEDEGSSRRFQQIFINGRLVRDRIIAHAIGAATEGFFPKGRLAAVLLLLECPPGTVDVNVHPAKTEVRFQESRRVHDLVYSALRGALERRVPISGMPIASGSPVDGARLVHDGGTGEAPHPLRVHEAAMRYLAWEEGTAPASGTAAPASALPGAPAVGQALGQYASTWILASDAEGLLLVDQHAAHERVVFEQLLRREEADSGATVQELLFPISVPWPLGLSLAPEHVLAALRDLGFEAEEGGPRALLVRGAPGVVEASRVPRLVADLLDQLAAEETPASRSLGREPLMATVACHSSVRAGMPLTPEKMNYVIQELFRTRTPLKCPHGRPTILRFSRIEIERGFDRR